jgi:hypothetical protein
MNKNLIREVLPTMVQAPLAAGATDVFSSKVDMQGYEGCLFVGNVGTVNSTGKIRLRAYGSASSTATSTSDGFTLTTTGSVITTTAGGSDGELALEVYRPRSRYLSCKVDRLSSSAEYGGTVAYRYGPKTISSTKGSTSALATAVFVVPQTTGST